MCLVPCRFSTHPISRLSFLAFQAQNQRQFSFATQRSRRQRHSFAPQEAHAGVRSHGAGEDAALRVDAQRHRRTRLPAGAGLGGSARTLRIFGHPEMETLGFLVLLQGVREHQSALCPNKGDPSLLRGPCMCFSRALVSLCVCFVSCFSGDELKWAHEKTAALRRDPSAWQWAGPAAPWAVALVRRLAGQSGQMVQWIGAGTPVNFRARSKGPANCSMSIMVWLWLI